MSRTRIPDEVLSAAHERARAREARDWAEADRLRGVIEAAGWKIVDRGTDFALSPAAPPDTEEGGSLRFGASGNVPSRLDEPETGLATVILVATDHPTDLARALTALRAHAPSGTSVVIVGDAPSEEQGRELDGLEEIPADEIDLPIEVVRTSERLGQGAALNIGLRRSGAGVVVVMDTSVEPRGDVVTPLVRALDDPSVAVAGGWGLRSADLRHFEEAGQDDVDAIGGYLQAFRRRDAIERGPFDERFRFYRNLDIWWSLVLRDEGEGGAPRRAVIVDVPAERHEHRGWTSVPEDERDRQSKRNFYRIIDRFGSRRDLLVGAETEATST